VLTFDPHPAVVLGRKQPALLTRRDRKLALLRELSPDLDVIVQPFDESLSRLSPRQFAKDVVLERHRAERVVVGANFRFGYQRAGDLATLRALGEELGFSTGMTELLTHGGETVSSSAIREAIARADLRQARSLLGRPHEIGGRVVPGDQLGRKLGFPTANLAEVEELLPANGVYVCRALLPNSDWLPAISNLGIRPTLEGERFGVEVHLLDYTGDLYGQPVRVQLLERVRAERQFDSLDALKKQIEIDIQRTRQTLAHSA
jgi:riboflavin kinase / FMN adenylyltransferase